MSGPAAGLLLDYCDHIYNLDSKPCLVLLPVLLPVSFVIQQS